MLQQRHLENLNKRRLESAPYPSSTGASEESSGNKRQTAQGMTGNDVPGAHGSTQNPATNQGKHKLMQRLSREGERIRLPLQQQR